MTDGQVILLIVVAIAAGVFAVVRVSSARRLRRAEFIRTYRWPQGLLDKLSQKHPALQRKETALISSGLRQFFLAYLMSGQRFVSMPSQIVDDLWHEFILYTREYQSFCSNAFGGFLHHSPAVVLGGAQKDNEGLRRVWWQCCKEENIDPHQPTRLPLLFALDGKLKIANGFTYQPDCEPWRKRRADAGGGAVHCASDFSSSSVDGGTTGLGDGDGGSDGGGGCGGSGCGGGGD